MTPKYGGNGLGYEDEDNSMILEWNTPLVSIYVALTYGRGLTKAKMLRVMEI